MRRPLGEKAPDIGIFWSVVFELFAVMGITNHCFLCCVASNTMKVGRCNLIPLLHSVSDLVSNLRYRIPFDQSELCVSKMPLTDSPATRPGRHPLIRPSISGRSALPVPPTLSLSKYDELL